MKQLIAGQENVISFPLIKERVGLYSVHLYQNVGDEEVLFTSITDDNVSVKYNYSSLDYDSLHYSTEPSGVENDCTFLFVTLTLAQGSIVKGGEYSLVVTEYGNNSNEFLRCLASVKSEYDISDNQDGSYLEPDESSNIYSDTKIL
tara:strand:+ start:17 stop:454 length:438 start_codon:yes stop_codon:yes gene_type:complete